jgi:glucose/arabinose dehydrogenase
MNDLFVASYTYGYIFHFDLNDDRTGFVLDAALADEVSDNFNETEQLVFAKNFGRITDMAVGPDGYLYVLSIQGLDGVVYRIVPTINN